MPLKVFYKKEAWRPSSKNYAYRLCPIARTNSGNFLVATQPNSITYFNQSGGHTPFDRGSYVNSILKYLFYILNFKNINLIIITNNN